MNGMGNTGSWTHIHTRKVDTNAHIHIAVLLCAVNQGTFSPLYARMCVSVALFKCICKQMMSCGYVVSHMQLAKDTSTRWNARHWAFTQTNTCNVCARTDLVHQRLRSYIVWAARD